MKRSSRARRRVLGAFTRSRKTSSTAGCTGWCGWREERIVPDLKGVKARRTGRDMLSVKTIS
ncbi:MAG: hypothetical protein NZ581_07690 [Candidatus Caldarchaeum sp.]|nr:hypothetical protein [Candidatus Caldarchaeum sp.]MDW8436056.1 hypothetical protein [Candidatus Caldarchaeum sp.]